MTEERCVVKVQHLIQWAKCNKIWLTKYLRLKTTEVTKLNPAFYVMVVACWMMSLMQGEERAETFCDLPVKDGIPGSTLFFGGFGTRRQTFTWTENKELFKDMGRAVSPRTKKLPYTLCLLSIATHFCGFGDRKERIKQLRSKSLRQIMFLCFFSHPQMALPSWLEL